jgi:hypothetical protein
MARPTSPKPNYCHHKKSGRAVTVLDGKFIYLGEYGTQASRDRYDAPSASGLPEAAGQRPRATRRRRRLTVTSLIHAFWQHAKTYYVHPDGTPTVNRRTFVRRCGRCGASTGPPPRLSLGRWR